MVVENYPLSVFRCALFFLFLLILRVLPAETKADPARVRETASLKAIKTELDKRKIQYAEDPLLSEYGLFGTSLFSNIGQTEAEKPLIAAVFPVFECDTDFVFSLVDKINGEGNTGITALSFLGDSFNLNNDGLPVSFENLLGKFENQDETIIIYAANGAVSLFQGELKNPYHLTAPFAQFLKDKAVNFTLDKDNSFFLDRNALSSVLIDFVKEKLTVSEKPDLHYFVLNFRSNYYFFSNKQIITSVIIIGAFLLFLSIAFSLFSKKIWKTASVVFGTAFIVFTAFVIRDNSVSAASKKEPDMPVLITTETIVTAEASIDIKSSVLLDRIIYKIKCQYAEYPYKIDIYFDIENTTGLTYIYEADFPYLIEDNAVFFILGKYPPNPFETEIAFPLDIEVKPRIMTALSGK